MAEAFPVFTYHLDPVANDVIEASEQVCMCCNQARGYIYVGPVFTTRRDVRDNICPWCIADGSAAEKFEAEFVDSRSLLKAKIPRQIVDHVTKRTPGYFCWQQDHWQSHCNDACVYHGDATVGDIESASPATIEAWQTEYEMKDGDWAQFSDGYEPKGHSAFYKFVCRHCGMVLLSWDLD